MTYSEQLLHKHLGIFEIGRSYSKKPNFISLLFYTTSPFYNEQTEAPRGYFLQPIRIKQNWGLPASSSPPIPPEVNAPPVSNVKLCGHQMYDVRRDWGTCTQWKNIQYLVFKNLKMSNEDSLSIC